MQARDMPQAGQSVLKRSRERQSGGPESKKAAGKISNTMGVTVINTSLATV